ncbi:uncharacterized protein LOC113326429 [Papaver somniferum]|uniref:uncharacterized protein LOC113326429 n=1 Tax=Papaver somniferum TaxID=3469 RepID=UPI000E6FED61|nr:uncharacterized protein LOC113326429 [Papaver somniferum]
MQRLRESLQCFEFPKSVLDDFDKLQRDFWWNKDNPKKAFYPKAWDNIRASKVAGGIGIRDPYKVNISLLAKLAWRLLKNPEDLWVKILRGKYFPRTHPFHKKKDYEISWIWHNIRLGLQVIKDNSIWQVGYGRNIHVSSDNWIPGMGRLTNWRHDDIQFVSDLIEADGGWNMDLIDSTLQPEIDNKIKSISLTKNSHDSLMWLGNRNGKFTTKSA